MNLLDELTTGPLSGELAPFISSGDDAAILAILTRKDIPAKKPVTAHDIRQYLMLVDLLLPIEASNADTCIATKRALEVFESFDLRNPVILAKFTQILDGLVAETLIPDFTEQHKADILSLGDTMISRVGQLGITVTIQDIAQALRG